MKKLLFQLIFLASVFPAMSQGWVYIHGTVTDIEHGYPIPGHAVTIMSDSTNGMFYYNTVFTDSTGVYYDDIPAMGDSTGVIYVQTLDCQDYLHQAVVYINPNNNLYTQDFEICSLNNPCQANFDYYPYPQGSPDSFHFSDLSTGNINAWSWSFGDGTGSVEQNPFHTFPGPGTFTVCLTASGNNCTDTYCRDIVISDTVYHQIYGQVYAGNFPLQSGAVMLFAMNPNGGYSPFGDPWPIDSNGVYYFTLVPDGTYIILAVPFDSINYIPTYFGDVINWQAASHVVLGVPDNPYNIKLVQAGQMIPGPGSMAGQINGIGLRANEVEKIKMILMDENGTPLGFNNVDSAGMFEFRGMGYGSYLLRAELPGISCDNLKLDITLEKPLVEVYLNFSGNSILGLDQINPAEQSISIYPNPARDQLFISMDFPGSSKIEVGLYTITGQKIYSTSAIVSSGQNIVVIPFKHLPEGLYMIRITSEEGLNVVQKVLK